MELTLNQLEQAINYWRARQPSTGEERALSPQVNALANVYAMMIFNQLRGVPLAQLDAFCQQLLAEWLSQSGQTA